MPIQKRRQQPMMAAAAAALCSTLLLLVLLGSAGTAEAFARPPAFIPALQQHQQARLRTGPLASPAPFALRGPTAASATRATTTRRMALWWPFGDLFGGSSSSSGAALKKKNVTETHEVVVIGAGVAGLVCAKELAAAGKEVLVLEAADRVGGRVQTDEVGGFLLDRGFQVFIEAYPAVKRQLDYAGLDLQPFWPGALVRAERGFHTVADPFRRPQDLLKGLLAPVGSLGDKVKVGLMRFTLGASASAALLQRPETDTETHLRRTKGFSAQMVDRFFRPFYQGIYLAPLAEQSSRMFDFVFKMFATGGISLPARGIRAVPEQLAAALPQGSVRLGARAKAVAGGRVELADGTVIAADAVVVATEEEAARKLLGERLRKERPKPLGGRGSTCLYYALDGRPPIRDPILILNGEGNGLGEQALNPVRVDGSGVGGGGSAGRVRARAGPPLTPAAGGRKKGASSSTAATRSGSSSSSSSSSVKKAAAPVQPAVRPVNNVVFLNSIAPAYAPPGKSLASVTVVGVPPGNDARLDQAVRAQLAGWFGADTVRAWELLRVYKIPYAQPKQTPPTGADGFARPAAVGEGLFVAGDHRNTATLNGAFESGEKAASAVLAHLGALGAAERVFKGTGAMGMAKTAVAAPATAAAAPAATKPRSGGPAKAAAVAAASGGDYLATIARGSGGGSKGGTRPAPVAGTATRGAISRFRDDLAAEKRRVRKLSGSITARRSLATKSRFREEELKRSGRRGQQPQGGSGGQGPARPAPTAAASGSGSGLPALRSREELVAEAERRMALIDSIMDRPAVPVAAPPKPTTQPAAPVAAKPAPAPTPAPAAAPPAAAPAPPASRPAMSSAGKGSSGGGSRFRQEDRGRRGG